MTQLSTNTEVLQQFGPEYGGSVVGWGVAEPNQDRSHAFATALVSRIEPDGAQLHVAREAGGKIVYMADAASGFIGTYEVDVIVDLETGNAVDSNAYTSKLQPFHCPQLPLSLSERSWSMLSTPGKIGAKAILSDIKQSLRTKELAVVYPSLYYRMAVASPDDMQLADPAMRRATYDELRRAAYVRSSFSRCVERNDLMVKRIQEASAKELPELAETEFLENRRLSMRYEQKRYAHIGRGVFGGMRLYPPTGRGKAGRTWPYMDAAASDERLSFGVELNALRDGNNAAVVRALNMESLELLGRRRAADVIVQKLSSLTRQEATIA